MKSLTERIAYLQGLAEGLEINTSTKEGKILLNILDVLEEMAESIEEIGNAQVELEDYIEAVDEDLYDLENEVLEAEEDCCCDHYDDDVDDEYLDEDVEFVEVECPKCHDVVCFEADIMDDEDVIEVTCPNCDHIVFVNDGNLEMSEED